MNKEEITINYKEWQEIMKDYEYQTKQASKYLSEAQKYSCELEKYKNMFENLEKFINDKMDKHWEEVGYDNIWYEYNDIICEIERLKNE